MSGKRPFLKDKNQLLNINFSRSDTWDIRINDKGIPSQFKSFFPAVSVTEPIFNSSSHTFSIGNSSLEVPNGFTMPSLKIEFYDNDKCELESFFETWVNQSIYGKFKSVLPLESSLKTIEVVKLDNKFNRIFSTKYKVCPKGELSRSNDSTPAFYTFSVDFIIASYSRS